MVAFSEVVLVPPVPDVTVVVLTTVDAAGVISFEPTSVVAMVTTVVTDLGVEVAPVVVIVIVLAFPFVVAHEVTVVFSRLVDVTVSGSGVIVAPTSVVWVTFAVTSSLAPVIC